MKLEDDKVVGPRGDVLAEKVYGEWQTKDPEVLAFIENNGSNKPAKKAAPKKKASPKQENKDDLEMVRARDENGHFIADDPSTPDVNEAWVVRTAKKLTKKK